MKTLKQLIREFWIPFLLAILWTVFSLRDSPHDRDAAGAIKTFGSAFFLISWATGQFVRVSRQARTEQGLSKVDEKLIKLTDRLEEATHRLASTISGGESFASLEVLMENPHTCTFFILNNGDYTLSNVNARIVDVDTFQENIESGKPFASDRHISIGEIPPKTAHLSGERVQIEPKQQKDWNVFFSARNGFWTQLIRGRVVNNELKFASVVFRDVEGAQPVLYASIPNGFPKIGEPLFDENSVDQRPK